ncbi:ASCH domain-containing protein [uncultured Parabacteroides sp.]|uniref:ASCH domain-containing protein n=1 Tax=uncultured Parabacteroides sp. TaxID=512312 RepID=UPI00259B34D0|nr:ASCH domain-containing protein [uncultured Parabacteroides sp.]
MKALSIKQPWASLIAHGIKDIENRTWRTNYRGCILIHASASYSKNFKVDFTDEQMKLSYSTIAKECMLGNFPFGTIIGSVEVVDCVQNHPSIWAEKEVWNWVLANAVLYQTPILAKGKLSLWEFEGFKEVKIKCPQCGSVETVLENHLTEPFSSYIHTCCKCGCVIMETGWNVIE